MIGAALSASTRPHRKGNLLQGSVQMTITWTILFTILLLITLAVLGHTVWHHEMVSIMNLLVEAFTGGHAVG
jgi:hypothetical protein